MNLVRPARSRFFWILLATLALSGRITWAQERYALEYIDLIPNVVSLALTPSGGILALISLGDYIDYELREFAVDGTLLRSRYIRHIQLHSGSGPRPSLTSTSTGVLILVTDEYGYLDYLRDDSHFDSRATSGEAEYLDGYLTPEPCCTADTLRSATVWVDRGDRQFVAAVDRRFIYYCVDGTTASSPWGCVSGLAFTQILPARLAGHELDSLDVGSPQIRRGLNLDVFAAFSTSTGLRSEIWQESADDSVPKKLFALDGSADAPVEVTPGTLWGTVRGGSYGAGAVYQVNVDGTGLRVIRQFQASDGTLGALQQTDDGRVWLTFLKSGRTAVFRMEADATFIPIIEFPSGSVSNVYFSSQALWIRRDAALYKASIVPEFGTQPDDLLLYNAVSGTWNLKSATRRSYADVSEGNWAAGWQIFSANFNADDLRDLFFYNPASGLFVKGINLGNGQFDFSVSYAWAPNWDIHVVDLNGDGQSDLFLYNATTGRWFAATTTGDGTGDFDYSRNGVWARGWTITPVDWDADGRTDLFAYNKTSGLWVKVTTLADTTFVFPALGYWAPGWNIYNADFDADGRSELFLYANGGTPIAGRNFVVRAVGDTFEYTEGMRWGPNWTVTIADLDGDGRSDIFLYDPGTGVWYEVFKDGVDSYYSGAWATNWNTALLHGGGNPGVLTATDALIVYNAATGMYFKVTPHGRGAFDYLGGTWPTGMTLIPLR